MDDEPLVAGRVYWALHGHRWVKAKVKKIVHKLDVNSLAEEDADHLEPNSIGHVELALQEPLATLPYDRSRALGSLVLVDTASHKTQGPCWFVDESQILKSARPPGERQYQNPIK